jgi:lysophospholipase L1-like esterase
MIDRRKNLAMSSFHPACVILALMLAVACAGAAQPGFAEFDRRAKSGERLNVVFFGASLTWGANATDPQSTSYRGLLSQRLEAAYPNAHFKFHDAAVGGTGSQLAVFRLQRDVLSRRPDLVFLDFSANDDIYTDNPETLASYEALVRRIILEARAPVVQAIFPFMWNVRAGSLEGMKRRDAHLAISRAYNTAAADAIALALERVRGKRTTLEDLWPVDGVHPGDAGYVLFADAVWDAFQGAVRSGLTCTVPPKMLYADTYMRSSRVRISTLLPLPDGWRVGRPNVTSAHYDMLMSRWLDDEVIVSIPEQPDDDPADKPQEPQTMPRLRVRFSGSMVMLLGESTPRSGKYRVYIDGKLVERADARKKGADARSKFDAAFLAKMSKGNVHLAQVIAEGLDPAVEHTMEIEPLLSDDEKELRLESICVAGGEAWVH